MGITYDSRLKEEYNRRNLAMERMRQACSATQQTISNEASGLKEGISPGNIVRRNPWYTLLGALVAGGLIGLVARKLFTPSRRRVSVHHEPERVVVEVKGAEKPHAAEHKKSSSTAVWKDIFDTALHGIPAVAAFVEQHMSKKNAPQNGGATMRERSEASATVSAGPEKGPPFTASISRRNTPPPREG